jgi:hypothetical protein
VWGDEEVVGDLDVPALTLSPGRSQTKVIFRPRQCLSLLDTVCVQGGMRGVTKRRGETLMCQLRRCHHDERQPR